MRKTKPHAAPLAIAVALVWVVSGCGAEQSASGEDLPSTDTDALSNVLKDVDESNPDNEWWPRVDRIEDGVLADAKIYTDYRIDDEDDMRAATDLCTAFHQAIQDDTPFAEVYGIEVTTDTNIDGSEEEGRDDEAKLAVSPGSIGPDVCSSLSPLDFGDE